MLLARKFMRGHQQPKQQSSFHNPRKPGWRFALKLAALLMGLGSFASGALASPFDARIDTAVLAVADGPAPLTVACHTVFTWIWTQLQELNHLVSPGFVRDVLGVLIGTVAFVPPMFMLKLSPVFGFLLLGVFMGPFGFGILQNVEFLHQAAEFGTLFLLFDTGLNLKRLGVYRTKFEVVKFGGIQFLASALLLAKLGSFLNLGLNNSCLFMIGGALAVSSTVFALRLLDGKLQTAYGQASVSMLHFHDFAVVPLLVAMPLIPEYSTALSWALTQAGLRALLAIGMVQVVFRYLLQKSLNWVDGHGNGMEALWSVTIATVILCSAVTHGLGLPSRVGAFLAGALLSESQCATQIQENVTLYRNLLVGLFFVTVGFSIDLRLVVTHAHILIPGVLLLLAVKGLVVILLCLANRIDLRSSIRAAIVLASGGELGFVVLNGASKAGLISEPLSQLLMTMTTVSMVLVPLVIRMCDEISQRIDDPTKRLIRQTDQNNIKLARSFRNSSNGSIFIFGHASVLEGLQGLFDVHDIGSTMLEPQTLKVLNKITSNCTRNPAVFGDCATREAIHFFKVCTMNIVMVKLHADAAAHEFHHMNTLMYCTHMDQLGGLCKAMNAKVIPKLPRNLSLLWLPTAAVILSYVKDSPSTPVASPHQTVELAHHSGWAHHQPLAAHGVGQTKLLLEGGIPYRDRKLHCVHHHADEHREKTSNVSRHSETPIIQYTHVWTKTPRP